jgi:isoquinoline 1-oxidoreductase alpha subunit
MIEFKLNGRRFHFKGDSKQPLLWVIREQAGLQGTKFGCGSGLCGACTVHVNGKARRSCVVPVKSVKGKSVTTIEGLSADGSHPVQRAWLELDVPQCGYCQPGQIMAAVDLLKNIPHPTDDDIDKLQTNLCRCGTYWRIRQAIHRAAELTAEES